MKTDNESAQSAPPTASPVVPRARVVQRVWYPIVRRGEMVHVGQIPRFERDVRRHFIGVVEAYDQGLMRVSGYSYVVEDPKRPLFQRRPERRTKVVSLVAAGHSIYIIPPGVNLEDIHYKMIQNRMVVTDGRAWTMDVKEFTES